MKHSKFSGLSRCFSVLLAVVLVLFCMPTVMTHAEDSVQNISSFQELKEAINKGGTAVLQLTKDIAFEEQLSLPEGAKITLKDDGQKRSLTMAPTMVNTDANKKGSGLLVVPAGSELVLAGTSNANLVFDGQRDPKATQLPYLYGQGFFITVNGKLIIQHATVANLNYYGGRTAAIYVEGKGSTVQIDDIDVTNCDGDYLGTAIAEDNGYPYAEWRNENNNYYNARANFLAAMYGAQITVNGGHFYKNGIAESYFSEQNLKQESPAEGTTCGLFALGGSNNFGKDASSLTINGGLFEDNNGGNTSVAFAGSLSTVTINGGEFRNNKSINNGGVFKAYIRGNLIINNGIFENNKCCVPGGGGGVAMGDWASTLTIENGQFIGNEADFGGAIGTTDRWREGTDDGGSAVNSLVQGSDMTYDDWKKSFANELTINNGVFKNNHARMAGGALYLSGSDMTINAGVFEGNSAVRFGGALYLSSVPYTLNIKNVLATGNKATDIDVPDLHWNHDGQEINLKNGSGGGIWYCPTGDTKLYISNGGIFYDNSAVNGADDVASVEKKNQVASTDPDLNNKAFSASIEQRVLGGGLANWYKDGSISGKNLPRYQNGDKPLESKDLTNQTGEVALKSIIGYQAVLAANDVAKVIFKDNVAGRGGAMATNGTIIIGDPDKTFNLKVNKVWSSDYKPDDVKDLKVTVQLLNVTNQDPQKHYVVDELVLDQAHNWEGVFENLPLEAGNKAIQYAIREKEADTYTVSYSGQGATQVLKDAKDFWAFTTGGLAPNSEVSGTVTNAPRKPDEPTQPSQPTQPTKPCQPWCPQPNPRPNEPVQPVPQPTNPEPSQTQPLPKTGEAQSMAGFVVLALGLTLVLIRRK